MVSRRSALRRLAAVAGAAGLSGCSRVLDPDRGRALSIEPNPNDVPARQHEWAPTLPTGPNGNRLGPVYRRVLLLDLRAEPDVERARRLERALRDLEAAYEWGPDGLLHMLAWGTAYFRRRGRLGAAPISPPRVLSRVDEPELQSFDAALVLASNVPSHLTAAEAALFGDRDTVAGRRVSADLSELFAVRERRTGFIGEGLPAEHADAEGVPAGALSASDPMFTGFFSGRDGTQASEDRVTIGDGPHAGGTTMHLSHLTENLRGWWEGLDDAERVALMFSPEFDPDDVDGFQRNVPFSDAVAEHAREHGAVGHHEKVAQVRRDGEPLVLRRDFNTVDGGQAGVHFISLQRRLDQFRKTRKAMNGWYVRDDHPDITDRHNNGLLEFIDVESRANFYVPPRDRRAFPGL